MKYNYKGDDKLVSLTEKTYVKKPPKPDYCKCNKGHQLQLIYMYDYDKYVWDCQTCINEMNKLREGGL